MLRSLLLFLATLSLVHASRRRCSHCRPHDEQNTPIPVQMTFLGVDPDYSNFDQTFQVYAGATLSYPAGTSGVSMLNGFASDVSVTPQQTQRLFSRTAWTASRSGRLKNLLVNILYITDYNTTAIPGAIGNVTITLFTASPGASYVTTGMSVTTPIYISPAYVSRSTATNVDVALSDLVHQSSIAAGTRVVALISYGWSSSTAITQGVAGYFWLSGGYLFD